MENNITCVACGAPNPPEAGRTHMACIYCGVTLTIPVAMRKMIAPEKKIGKTEVGSGPSMEASKILRKAQPIAIRAWNYYALWTRIRWLIPTCLTILVIGVVFCLLAGILPILLNIIHSANGLPL